MLEGWSPTPGSVKITAQDADVAILPRQISISVERSLLSVSTSKGLNSVYSDAGDSATFEITITNTGNTVLSEVVLTDSAVDVETSDCDQDYTATDSEFLPDAHPSSTTIVCSVTVPITAAHVDAGGFSGTSKVCCPVVPRLPWRCG